jgi:hypothetical protein
MIRPRAADDFAVIRTRLEGLGRERVLAPAKPQARAGTRSSHPTSTDPPAAARPLPSATHQKLFLQP